MRGSHDRSVEQGPCHARNAENLAGSVASRGETREEARAVDAGSRAARPVGGRAIHLDAVRSTRRARMIRFPLLDRMLGEDQRAELRRKLVLF